MKKIILLSTVSSLLIFSTSCEKQDDIIGNDENIETFQVDLSDVKRPGTREVQSVDLSNIQRPGTRNSG
ncbi:hypothetical protein [Aquimarina longa]|uniref:hypothetical protein n=1 Tax=Aquimarina longa TaxID=1080221 RepID=UPI000A9EC02A|nr:hypothetical protein [Aquimarina longa]